MSIHVLAVTLPNGVPARTARLFDAPCSADLPPGENCTIDRPRCRVHVLADVALCRWYRRRDGAARAGR